jgi:hypothetical protein
MGDGAERRWRIRPSWIVLGALGILGLIVLGIPLATLLYIGVLLLCPLMMVGMHAGHGGNDGSPRGHEDHGSSGGGHWEGRDLKQAGR